jgi:autophagy-related protein 18
MFDLHVLGRFVLSPSIENSYLCFSDNISEGEIEIYDVFNLIPKAKIRAHNSPIKAMAINYRGSLLATSSCEGSIVRVFSLPKGTRLFSFKRGISTVTMFSINFNSNSNLLVTTSDSGTLHLFQIDVANESTRKGGEETPKY